MEADPEPKHLFWHWETMIDEENEQEGSTASKILNVGDALAGQYYSRKYHDVSWFHSVTYKTLD